MWSPTMSKIFVVAGRFDQFRIFRHQLFEAMCEEGIEFRYQDLVYVSSSMVIRGYHDPWGYKVGTWFDRDDINEIDMILLVAGSSLQEDFIEVLL